MEPQYYPGKGEVREQLQRTQDVEWATRVLVYGAVNKLPGWPSVWELLKITQGGDEGLVRARLRLFAARLISSAAGRAVQLLPDSTQMKILDKLKKNAL